MADAPSHSRIAVHAAALLQRVRILENPYFANLMNGSMSLDFFRTTQEQFFYAVTFFPRPMAALVGRIPDPRLRLDILHNLVEEHGDFDERFFHHTTFQQFLKSIGADPEKLSSKPLWPVTRGFNSTLATACTLDELEVGVACMGIIEYSFASISSLIGKAVVMRGFVSEEDLVHYKLHAAIDERHATEFFAIIEPQWDDPARRVFIEQGLGLGAYAFDRLYRDLYEGGLHPDNSARALPIG